MGMGGHWPRWSFLQPPSSIQAPIGGGAASGTPWPRRGLLAGQSGGETGHTPSPLQGTPLCCLGLCPPQAASAATYGFWEPQGLGISPQAEGGIALTQGIGDGEGALAELGPGVIQAESLWGLSYPDSTATGRWLGFGVRLAGAQVCVRNITPAPPTGTGTVTSHGPAWVRVQAPRGLT